MSSSNGGDGVDGGGPKEDVVELVRIVRRGKLVWNFDRDHFPPSTAAASSSRWLVERGIPIELWRTTYDRLDATKQDFQKRLIVIFTRKHYCFLLGLLPVVYYFQIVMRYMYGLFPESGGKLFLWRAWLVTNLAVILCVCASYCIIRYYIKPSIAKLDKGGYQRLASELQSMYHPYGVTVQVKRVPVVPTRYAELFPDGLISSGLILSSTGTTPQQPDHVTPVVPTALARAGVPLGTWAYTVGQCSELHENELQRMKKASQFMAKCIMVCFWYFVPICYMILPIIAWMIDYTENDQIANLFWSYLAFAALLAFVLTWILQGCSTIRAEWAQCDDDWQALAIRTEPIYAQYNVTVNVQRRDIPYDDPNVKVAFLLMLGNTTRSVGMSFRNVDGLVVSIEFGKVLEGEDEVVALQSNNNNSLPTRTVDHNDNEEANILVLPPMV